MTAPAFSDYIRTMQNLILPLILAVPVSFTYADERMPQASRRGCQGRMVSRMVDDTVREQRRMLIESFEFDGDDRVQSDWDGSYSNGNDARDPDGF